MGGGGGLVSFQKKMPASIVFLSGQRVSTSLPTLSGESLT